MKKNISLIILGIIIISLIVLTVYTIIFRPNDGASEKTNVIATIKGFDYTLDDRDTKLFADEFKNLRSILTAKEIDYEAYAISLSKLYIIDFYTLTNKITKNDVGSLEYLPQGQVENFKLKAMDTMYKYLENNINGKRKQQLPEVKEILSVDLETTTKKIENDEIEAIKITIEWSYVTDLGYDEKAELILIRQDNKLVITDIKPL